MFFGRVGFYYTKNAVFNTRFGTRFQDEVVGPLFGHGATSNQDIFTKNYSPEKKRSSISDVKIHVDSIFRL